MLQSRDTGNPFAEVKRQVVRLLLSSPVPKQVLHLAHYRWRCS